jgi:hypothetical protein
VENQEPEPTSFKQAVNHNVKAVAEMENKILEFLEQQRPHGIGDFIAQTAIKSLAFKAGLLV